MYVSISEAARLAGIKSRSTFYRHIKSKGITVTDDAEGNPQIDTAELIRVYGSKIKLPEQGGNTGQDRSESKQVVQNSTPVIKHEQGRVEIEVLKERVKHLEAAREMMDTERRKERELLSDQVDTLKKTVEEAQSQNKRLTALITDQSSSLKEKDGERDSKIQKLESLIMELKADNDRMKAIAEERRKRVEEKRKAREAELKAAEEAVEAQKSRGFFSKLFG